VVDQDFFEQYRRAAGGVMGLLYIEIMRDLYEKYPELEPAAFR